ncbi:MAG: four helix bundle protein [Saprospiraceae bacterium]|nr:four helix bundle protein [Saprospiraceae bacterium]MBK8296827.1 four helix bundle protein [Saprospiraceae bacterium]
MFEFQNLEIYKKAKAFHVAMNLLIQKTKLQKNIVDQLYRASFSISLNIAEGSGRFSKPDRRNFFIISRSSVFECVAIVDSILDEGHFSNAQH